MTAYRRKGAILAPSNFPGHGAERRAMISKLLPSLRSSGSRTITLSAAREAR